MNESHATIEVSQAAMEALARELEVPLDQVEQACKRQATAIHADARIRKFVPVLIASRVRSELRRQQRGS